jgi:hypothetical protein
MTERKPDWTIVSHFQNYDEALNNVASLIFEMHGEYWQLSADGNKLLDVMNMPSYIVSDWLWANRKHVEEYVADWHIERSVADLAYQQRSRNNKSAIEAAEEKLAILKSVKRTSRIDRIL